MIESWNLGYKFQIYKRIDGNSLTTDTSLFLRGFGVRFAYLITP